MIWKFMAVFHTTYTVCLLVQSVIERRPNVQVVFSSQAWNILVVYNVCVNASWLPLVSRVRLALKLCTSNVLSKLYL